VLIDRYCCTVVVTGLRRDFLPSAQLLCELSVTGALVFEQLDIISLAVVCTVAQQLTRFQMT